MASGGRGPLGPAPDLVRTYQAEDAGVFAPVAIQQELPVLPSVLLAAARPRGVIEVVIDEQGRVVSMNVKDSIHPAYDAQLLVSARDWKYAPATVAGHPVKFQKLIQIVVKR